MLKIVSTSGFDPIGYTLSDVKEHCYVTGTAFDTILTFLSKVAREYAEARTWRQILPASYILYLDSFPDLIELPKPPTISVTSVKYYDSDDSLTPWDSSNYQVDLKSEPARIRPVSGTSFPDTYDRMNAVEIAFTAGYDRSSEPYEVPEKIIQAQMMFIKHLFDNRETIIVSEGRSIDAKEVPYTTNHLLDMESARIYV